MLRFGTDGVRGNADAELTDDFVEALGRAVARVMGPREFVVGRDTRASGVRIERAFARGLSATGATTIAIGVAPTPAIAFCAQQRSVPAAIVSASHNPWTDNGVKVIGADGWKLADEVEAEIERELEATYGATHGSMASASDGGTPSRLTFDADDAMTMSYVEHLVVSLDGRTLDGLKVVVDCANGAAFQVAPRALRAAGAAVTVLHASPDGHNINAQCGSTYPNALQATVVAHGADVGLALDGDADRVVAVDEQGEIVDGDQIMVMTALDLHERGALRHDAIAVTVMSNLGLRRALARESIDVVETPVGDRYVVAAMRERDLVLGGEQSGHIVYADRATTGDGILTGLLVADLVRRTGMSLSTLGASMTRLPQVLVNVKLAHRVDLESSPAVRDALGAAEARLGERGRIVLRTSGTEPLVRIMVEAPTEGEASEVAGQVREAVVRAFGL